MITIDEFGALNKRIRIMAYGDYDDEFGIAHTGMKDMLGHRIWARIDPVRAKSYEDLDREKVENFYKVTIRYRNGIDAGMVVRYGNTDYEIRSIVDPMMAHVKLELMCSAKEVKDGDY